MALDTSRVQKASKSGSEGNREPASIAAKVGQIPRNSHLRDVLAFLAETADPVTGKTLFMSRREIEARTGKRPETIKTSLRRMREKKLLKTAEIDHSPHAGGATYFIYRHVIKRLWEDGVLPLPTRAENEKCTTLVSQ